MPLVLFVRKYTKDEDGAAHAAITVIDNKGTNLEPKLEA